jgi:hypothetical protein
MTDELKQKFIQKLKVVKGKILKYPTKFRPCFYHRGLWNMNTGRRRNLHEQCNSQVQQVQVVEST